MRRITLVALAALVFGALATSCHPEKTEGKLMIIGGGYKPDDMVDQMITASGIDKGGYGVVLPMASEQPDTEIVETKGDFLRRGYSNVYGLNCKKGTVLTEARLDSIRNARLIFISGGDQSRFMDAIKGTPIEEIIHDVFNRGGMICGTSAGAAVMSRKMITGNERKYPDDSGNFLTMEAGNIEVTVGLGMLEQAIIDQHFIKRKRLNRLVSVCMENPENTCVGIDESTAIFVHAGKAVVVGLNQVVVIRPSGAPATVTNGLLGARNMELDVLLPGDSFPIH
jgi:cyanophycinase